MYRSLAFALAAAGAWATPASAVTLILSPDSILLGAQNVDVGGVLYDVSFVDGTCAATFGGCDQANFTFQSEADALLAATALRDQVLLDVPQGNFDTVLELTFGCTPAASCSFFIPYAVDTSGPTAQLLVGRFLNRPGNDVVGTVNIGVAGETNEEQVWARFSPAPLQSAVPEPGTWAFLLLGFGMVGASLRATRRARAVHAA